MRWLVFTAVGGEVPHLRHAASCACTMTKLVWALKAAELSRRAGRSEGLFSDRRFHACGDEVRAGVSALNRGIP